MLIDWFTVAAQVVNFLVLLWLLRRFLYGPITRAMQQRQQRIDEQVAEAERLRAQAAEEREELRARSASFAAEADRRERRLHEELEATRREQLTQARAELDQLQHQWRAAVRREEASFLAQLRQRTGEQMVEVVRQAVRDLADATLESQVIHRFLASLQELAPEDRDALLAAAHAEGDRLRLVTAFELPEELHDQLEKGVVAALGPVCSLDFHTDPAVLAGVELRADGQALAWTFDDYLDALEAAVTEALGEDRMTHDDP